MKATILGIGTELTTGQITNKNGSWLSKQLIDYGVTTSAHIVVPDDKKLIIDGLGFCSKTSQVIFITGGLGPTSDDFTRDVISEWTGTKLIFNEDSWQHVKNRLSQRGFEAKDIQRQQCYFPENSKILSNAHGTANGFYLKHVINSFIFHLFVLPGPPREIESIWTDHIADWLQENTRTLDKTVTKSWDTLGVGESDVATRVNHALNGKTESLPLDVGYRVHLPYVEVKLSYPVSASYTCDMFVKNVDHALKDITVLKDFQDITVLFSEKIQNTDFAIYDFVSGGFLHYRLSQQLKKQKNWMWKENSEPMDPDFFTDEQNFLALIPVNDFESILMFEFFGQRQSIQIEITQTSLKSALMKERRNQYFAEMALLEFVKSTSRASKKSSDLN
jgi:nicotinamide-nucleotide amidase